VTPPSFAISWMRIWSSDDDDDDSLCCVNDELIALLLVIAIHGRQSMLALAMVVYNDVVVSSDSIVVCTDTY